MSNEFFYALWLFNLIFTVLYTLFILKKGDKPFLFLFFVSLPILGFALYWLASLALRIFKVHSYDRDSLIKRYELSKVEKDPALQKELDLVPVPDAMAVASNEEKRALLLDQLKKGMQSNYKYILPASADKDSESAHYVAASMMEVYRRKRSALQEKQELLLKEPNNAALIHDYLASLSDYMSSGLVSTQEAIVYEEDYCRLFERFQGRDQVTAQENADYLSCLIQLNQKEKAVEHWGSCSQALKNEACYRQMLELFYNNREKDAFYRCLQELKQSDIILSPEGMQMLRFWNSRG